MRARPIQEHRLTDDVPHLPDWRQDARLAELTDRRTRLQAQEAQLTEAIRLAEAQAEGRVSYVEDTEALVMTGSLGAQELVEAQTAAEQVRQQLQRLRGELLLCQRERATIDRALPIVETAAKESCAEALRTAYTEAAAELAELLPRFIGVQTRLHDIFGAARHCFPPLAQVPDGAPAPVPPVAGLPFLVLHEFVPRLAPSAITPRPPGHHGGKVGKLQRTLTRFLEEAEASATAEA